jgi:hypothetical protein
MMSQTKREVISILDGVTELIEEWLGIAGVPEFKKRPIKSKKAAKKLSERGGRLNGAATDQGAAAELAKLVVTKIKKNVVTIGRQFHGGTNWKVRQAKTDNGNRFEKRLEKLLVNNYPEWFNQVPTCSGMAYKKEGKRSVDLGCPIEPPEIGGFELIELKFGKATRNFGSDNPLYAAFEHFQYAALYIICRQLLEDGHASFDDTRLLTARRIDWIVWAPQGYYRYRRQGQTNVFDYHYKWLERVLTSALQELAKTLKYPPPQMRFQFCAMTPELEAILASDEKSAEQSLDKTHILRIPMYQ